ncbi:HIT-like domain-containing protein [Dichotomocladium elegans]|nr:HIT-like domain-containing protein [Dichotomocladium elegans]
MVLCCFGCTACPFCDVSVEKGFKIVHEDQYLIAFRDRSPGAQVHLLIIPREHIKSVKQLDVSHVPTLEKMMTLGRKLLNDEGFDTQVRFGFHVPPFNSIDHLHLHVLGLPFKNTFRKLKYSPGMPWFAEASQVLDRLRQGLSPVE